MSETTPKAENTATKETKETAKKSTAKKKMNIYEKLQAIQCEMKAPKNLYNSFGGYKYRNAEGILETLKPFLTKHNVTVMLRDEIKAFGEGEQSRFYVQAFATFIDNESLEKIEVSALAREALTKKGMDDSQITGTASSYARKYALNGLFLLDDTKDADSDEYHKQTNSNTAPSQPNQKAGNSKWAM